LRDVEFNYASSTDNGDIGSNLPHFCTLIGIRAHGVG